MSENLEPVQRGVVVEKYIVEYLKFKDYASNKDL